MNPKHVLSFAALAAFCLAASAQTQAPGLWEHTMNMKSSSGEMERAMAEMQKQMAAMPPEQRKQMEQMMASRGVKIGAQGTTVKACITKEEAAVPPETRMPGDCKQSDVQRSGNKMSYKFECAKPPSKGEGEVTFISDKAYSGSSTVDSVVAGKPQQVKMEMSGKWLASDCGDVKPKAAAPAK
jgi:hypothetical protein